PRNSCCGRWIPSATLPPERGCHTGRQPLFQDPEMPIHKILVVDDSKTELHHLSDILGRHGYTVRIEQHGVIGISADQQPGVATIAELADLMVDEGTYTLYVNPIYSDAYIQTLKTEIQSKTGNEVHVLKLYLMLGPTDDMDYITQMEQNLENLKKGLVG
ncbi:MAG: zinc ABC transporter substrate-binding protein, partial [Thermoplasmata archaeon]